MENKTVKEIVNMTESTTIRMKSAALTNRVCNYLRRCGYNTALERVQDGYSIKICGLDSETAHKLVGKLIKKIRQVILNAQTAA